MFCRRDISVCAPLPPEAIPMTDIYHTLLPFYCIELDLYSPTMDHGWYSMFHIVGTHFLPERKNCHCMLGNTFIRPSDEMVLKNMTSSTTLK